MCYQNFMYKISRAVLLLLCFVNQQVMAGENFRVSVDSNGIQGSAGSNSPSISASGRYIAFTSEASNLVVGDTNNDLDVFVHDRLTKTTSLVSTDSNGVHGNSASVDAIISADGRFVCFTSASSNLVPDDTNNKVDVFVYDRLSKTTSRVSIDSVGLQGNSNSYLPAISADGRFVAYFSIASNLVAGDTNNRFDFFVHDRLSKTTNRVSVASDGSQSGDGTLSHVRPAISADGRYIAFTYFASNLVAGDTNRVDDIFVHDRKTKTTSRVSVDSNGIQGNSWSGAPSISADGRFVTFVSWSKNLVSNDTNKMGDIFVHDRLSKITGRVSVDSNGVQADSYSLIPNISADGRFVTFASLSKNLVSNDTNNTGDIFVHDRLTKITSRVSLDSNEVQADSTSYFPSVSADGRFVAFESYASSLVAKDSNGEDDIFVHDIAPSTQRQTDLALKTSQSPQFLAADGSGQFVITVTNKGVDAVSSIQLTHVISNGTIIHLKPSQGSCKSFALISLCTLPGLQPGQSLTLIVDAKATGVELIQNISISNNNSADAKPTNNYLTLTTSVTP